MDAVLLDLLISGGSHGILIVVCIVLYRDNRELRKELKNNSAVTRSTQALVSAQTDQIKAVRQHQTGDTPIKGTKPPGTSQNGL